MLRILGVLINLGVVVYLGYQLSTYMAEQEIQWADTSQNPLILSFVAVVGLFLVLKH